MLKLALASRLPLIHINTDDTINLEDVLMKVAGTNKIAIPDLPVACKDPGALEFPEDIEIFYTSREIEYLGGLYTRLAEIGKTVVFVNTKKSPLMYIGGHLIPPKEAVEDYLSLIEGIPPAAELIPSLGGMTLKDIGEVLKMTSTRDNEVTAQGINQTRKGYSKLQGITQVDTEQEYYLPDGDLAKWLKHNLKFFKDSKMHPSLIPRGLLFGGPPGTGKTEGSKYIARNFGVPLYRLDLGAMMGKFVGESENNLNAALAQVDEVAPCVVIFDEMEKTFQTSSDSGVSGRLLSQLLWWLQDHKSRVFTVMTTNNAAIIPQELYREGRIDKTLTFKGIAGKDNGYKFAKQVFDNVLKSLEFETDQEGYSLLLKRVAGLYQATEGAVPQAKLTTLAHNLIKELVSAEDDETPQEEAAAVVGK